MAAADSSLPTDQPDPTPPAGAVWPPAGFVDVPGAAAFFGISSGVLREWISKGRLSCRGVMVNGPNGKRGRIWPIAELERAREAMANPDGWVPGDEAAALFGLTIHAWRKWVQDKRVPQGRWGHGPTGKRCLLFPLDELKRLKAQRDEEMARAERRLEPYPDPDRPGVYRLPVASDKHKGMEALIDADALPLVQGKRWNWSGGRADGSGASVVIPGGGSLGRIIMAVADDTALLVSHVNGDRLDCRRENLLVRTRSEVKRASKRPKKWEGLVPYPDRERPGIVRVPILTDKHRGMEALIDAADLPLIEGKRFNWSPGKPDPSKGGTVMLAITGTPKPSLARIILGIDETGLKVCHRNGDRLDCRCENLVVRTQREVKWVSRKVTVKGGHQSTSRFKGVTRSESGRKWYAAIYVGGEWRRLGRFRSEIDAALAYDGALRELMGEDVAGLNLPDPAEVQRLRALEPVVEDGPFPPPGMVDRHEACAMFGGVSLTTWMVWERRGRITCGQYHPLPNDKPGRCKLYPKAELERLRVEIEQLGKPYADADRPGVWRVPLKSYLAYREVLIDERDLPIVVGKNWNWSDRTDGRVDGQVILATVEGPATPLSRIILGATDRWTMRVMHANGDPLDCRRANLLVKTIQEQVHSSRPMETRAGQPCTSKFKGVAWDQSRGKWRALIRKEGVNRFIGRFDDEIAAAEAYDEAAREWFGEHAWLNFPDGVDAWIERKAA